MVGSFEEGEEGEDGPETNFSEAELGTNSNFLIITSWVSPSEGASPLFSHRLNRTFSLPGGGLSGPK